jgi:hypothetical protein
VICGEMKATIAFAIRGVAKEDTLGGQRGVLVGHGGGSVRVTHKMYRCSYNGAESKTARCG